VPAREFYVFGMKFPGNSSHLFNGFSLPFDGALRTVFRVVPRDLTAEFWKVPVDGWAAITETLDYLIH